MKETRKKAERCASEDDCPAMAEIGRPEKLSRHNKDRHCYRCRARRADKATSSRERRVQGGLPRVSAFQRRDRPGGHRGSATGGTS